MIMNIVIFIFRFDIINVKEQDKSYLAN